MKFLEFGISSLDIMLVFSGSGLFKALGHLIAAQFLNPSSLSAFARFNESKLSAKSLRPSSDRVLALAILYILDFFSICFWSIVLDGLMSF